MKQKTKKIRIGDQLTIGISTITIILSSLALWLTYLGLDYHNENAINGYSLKKIQNERSDKLFAIELLEMEIADLGRLE
ncbi:TPA: hypothetical protein EYG96_01525 [Candidatus Gracilibacteria bacterium]|nr:hypothetical protein [Candidatus Peregrinibacteria bacterium]HIQ56703.1 hypothetical protein [Candidatus Gracilibacteria bacterium]HIQ57261.1 hypothetical protein [Candidatus Gracilibacteria bacterium]